MNPVLSSTSPAMGSSPEVAHLSGSSASRADDVVMVGRLADHIGVHAVGQVEPLDEPKLLEQLQCAEDRRSTDGEATPFRLADELEGGEMFVTIREHLGDGSAGSRDEPAGSIERVGPGLRVRHGWE